jgi:hypothetical protein
MPDSATAAIEAIRDGLPDGVELAEREELCSTWQQGRPAMSPEWSQTLRTAAIWSPALGART